MFVVCSVCVRHLSMAEFNVCVCVCVYLDIRVRVNEVRMQREFGQTGLNVKN